jgi:hypothetical protein
MRPLRRWNGGMLVSLITFTASAYVGS